MFGPVAAVGLVALFVSPARAAVRVMSDERVELVALIQRLSGDESLGEIPAGGPAGAIIDAFSPHRGDPAVRLMAAMRSSGFTNAIPTQYALYLSTGPEFKEQYPVPGIFVKDAGSRKSLDAFLRALNEFRIAAHFDSWFAAHKKERERLVAAFMRSAGGMDMEAPLQAYVGARTWKDIVVVLSPELPSNAHSNWVLEEAPGLPDVYVLTGPIRWQNGDADFGSAKTVAWTLWPETVYSAIYVLWDRCLQLQASPGLCARRGGGAYPSTEFCSQRLWVDAVLRRLSLEVFKVPVDGQPDLGARKSIPRRLDAVLAAYETARDRYPTLFDDAVALAAPLSVTGDPRCKAVDWSRMNRVYSKRLGIFLDQWISRAPTAEALRDRVQLRAYEGDDAGAEQDARSAVAIAPNDYEAWGDLAMLLQRRGAKAQALQAFDRAYNLAHAQRDVDPGFLADLLSSRATLEAAEGDSAAAAADDSLALSVAPADWRHRSQISGGLKDDPAGAPAAYPAPRLKLAADPRIELLGVVRMLAFPDEHRRLFAAGGWDYVRAEEQYFATFSTEPVVARLRRWKASGVPDSAPAVLLLNVSDPPELAASRVPDEALFLVGGEREAKDFLSELHDFAVKSRFQNFYDARKAEYRSWTEEAESEGRGGLTVPELESYIRTPFDKTYVFILAPFLPRSCAANTTIGTGAHSVFVRMFWMRTGASSKVRFEFESFGNSVAHELLHTIVSPWAFPYERELDEKKPDAPHGCGDYIRGGWYACLDEQTVLAVTLRASAADGRREAYERRLADYERAGFPQLGALCDRLRQFESEPASYPALPDFFPRLLDVFSRAYGVTLTGVSVDAPSPSSLPKTADSPARRYNDLGVQAYLKGDVAVAAEDFDKAIAADPRDIQSRIDCGVADQKLGRAAAALDCYDAAVRLARDAQSISDGALLADALSSRAALWRVLGRRSDAVRDLKEALAIAPKTWPHRKDAEDQARSLEPAAP